MDELVKQIVTSLEVNTSDNDKAGTSNSRLSQYKVIERCSSSQDDRRRKVLEEQKQRRDDVLTKFRGLFEEFDSENEDCMEWSQVQKVKKKSKKNLQFIKQIMFSEWFMDIPFDFDTHWLVKPCPVGQRTLLVAGGGRTVSYFKNGRVRRSMNSCLPGGSKCEQNFRAKHIVLDCIYCHDTKVHYVLDVLYWKFPMLSSTAEFRFYWLKSKLNEMSLESAASDKNLAKIVLLPHYPTSELATLMASYPIFPDNSPELDGLLFYHQLGFYEPGRTPLVGWIKPFMIQDKFSVPVHEAYLKRQDSEDIINLIKKENNRYYSTSKECKQKRRRKKKRNMMETNEHLNSNEDSMEAS